MALTHIRVAVFATFVVAGAAHATLASPISKEACVDAHSRGQDARDAGKVSLARKLFLSCAQNACPALVQSDCAKFANDLDQQQPTLTFAARDSNGNDLPDTTVYVDDILIVTRLADGLPHDADPGSHVIKFQNNGRDEVMTVVLSSGEKGRAVIARFPAPGGELAKPDTAGAAGVGAAPMTGTPVAAVRVHAEPKTSHPAGSKIAIVSGGVALLAGAAMAIVGNKQIPSGCSSSTHTCIAPPGDPELSTAQKALRLQDIGITVGAVGAAALVGGVLWYLTGSHTEREPTPGLGAAPWLSPNAVGVLLSGHL
jgi:hypothetical protein